MINITKKEVPKKVAYTSLARRLLQELTDDECSVASGLTPVQIRVLRSTIYREAKRVGLHVTIGVSENEIAVCRYNKII